MTPSEVERLARLETQIEGVDKRTERIEGKLDMVIAMKADRAEVDALCGVVAKAKSQLDNYRGALIVISFAVPLFTGVILAFVNRWLG